VAIDQYAEAALGNRDFFLNKPYAIGIIANARSLGFVIVRLDRRDLVWINVTANPTAEWVAGQITEAFPLAILYLTNPAYLRPETPCLVAKAFRRASTAM
jgi:hypothetical protein